MVGLRLPPLPSTREIIKLYKLSAKKQLSQNFLLDQNLTNKIVRKAGNLADCQVIEVGPGPGGITRSILQANPKRLTVIEKDRRFEPSLVMLSEAFEAVNGRMDVVFDDVMTVGLEHFISEEDRKEWSEQMPKIHLIGNLPFNVSTPLIIKWLHRLSERQGAWAFGRTRMTLTFQKEVAERLVAPPDDIQRCRLSVMAQAWTMPLLRFVIPGSAFVPAPKVDVGVVSFVPLKEPKTRHNFKTFEKVARHLFSFRQKYCIRGIETLFPVHLRRELGLMMFKLTDIKPETRSYELTVEEVDRLVSAYLYLAEKHPGILEYEYRASRRLLTEDYTSDVELEEVTA